MWYFLMTMIFIIFSMILLFFNFLIFQVEELILEDSRIDQYPKLIKGESKIVLEWQGINYFQNFSSQFHLLAHNVVLLISAIWQLKTWSFICSWMNFDLTITFVLTHFLSNEIGQEMTTSWNNSCSIVKVNNSYTQWNVCFPQLNRCYTMFQQAKSLFLCGWLLILSPIALTYRVSRRELVINFLRISNNHFLICGQVRTWRAPDWSRFSNCIWCTCCYPIGSPWDLLQLELYDCESD